MTVSLEPFGLLDLPPEVIGRIYELSDVYGRNGPCRLSTNAPECSALLPLTRDSRYFRTRIASHAKQVAFARLVADTPDIGSSVRELHLEDYGTRAAPRPGRLLQAYGLDLGRIWPTFTRLRSLDIAGAES